MFNDDRIDELEKRIERIERYGIKITTESGDMYIVTAFQMLLRRLKLRITTTEPVTKFEEIINAETETN